MWLGTGRQNLHFSPLCFEVSSIVLVLRYSLPWAFVCILIGCSQQTIIYNIGRYSFWFFAALFGSSSSKFLSSGFLCWMLSSEAGPLPPACRFFHFFILGISLLYWRFWKQHLQIPFVFEQFPWIRRLPFETIFNVFHHMPWVCDTLCSLGRELFWFF